MDFIDLAAQQRLIKADVDKRMQAVLAHGRYILGPEVAQLEQQLHEYTASRHSIAVSSGTDALQLALMALEIGPGDEVITTAFSFFATGEVIALLGAKPVYVDIDPLTYNIDPQLIEAAINEKTKAIMPVSLYGQCADFAAINAIAGKYKLPVIEDGAQSFGAEYQGKKSCAVSTIGCTSFFPSKPLGCYGDGGAVFTDDDKLAERIRQLHVHGQERRYYHPHIGINGRMDTLQAAVLLAKMEIFPDEVKARAEIGSRYSAMIAEACGDRVRLPHLAKGNTSVYAQYTIEVSQREQLQDLLKQQGIPTAVHYPVPLNQQPALSDDSCSVPLSEAAAQKVMSLPMHPYLSEEEQAQVVQALKTSLDKIA